MFALLKNNLLWTQGWQIVVASIIVLLFSYVLFPRSLFLAVTFLVTAFFIFSIYFFRNPQRECSASLHDSTVLVCPADGKVVDVAYSEDNGFEGYAQKVSIFLSPLDVHVNWIPCAGIVKQVRYKTGTFKMAFLPKSSEFNERNDVVLQREDGSTLIVRQIAGTIARRICCWVNEGQQVNAGDKFGMIRFGSRVDILLPRSAQIAVEVGQRVYGGQTVLGRLPGRSL